MRLKFIKDEDFINYKKPSMFIGLGRCDWKCCHEQGISETVCQNYDWIKQPEIIIPASMIVERYLNNPITSAIVIGGLEPLMQFKEVIDLIRDLRKQTEDDIVVYSGYYPEEKKQEIRELSSYKNIIVKFGRYISNDIPRYDEILGVTLASSNQYAIYYE